MKRHPTTPMKTRLSELNISGFKCHRDGSSVAFGGLTVLAGANSSGKSSLMQPLLLLKQTLEAPYDAGPLHLAGPNVTFSHADQLLWRSDRRDAFSVGVWVGDEGASLDFHRKDAGLVLEMASYQTEAGHLSLWPILGERISTHELRLQSLDDPEHARDTELGVKPIPWGKGEALIKRERCFLVARADSGETMLPPPVTTTIDLVKRVLTTMIHLPGLRGNPSRLYRRAATGPEFPGLFSDYAASLLVEMDDDKKRTVEKAMTRLGLTSRVTARAVDATSVEIRVGRSPAPARGQRRDLVNIADVGFGTSQVLPVVVALAIAQRNQLVYVEQPEIHLHPKAQVAMAELLRDAVVRGAQVVVETHSELLITALQHQVASGKIDAENVALYWFERAKDGACKIARGTVDETGAFGDWPVDFADVSMLLDRRYAEAAFSGLRARDASKR